MGRTNLVILCFGIFACVALSLMMGHVVTLKDKKEVHPAIFELHNVFGEQLERRPMFEIEERGKRKVLVLTVAPKHPESGARLARTLGRYLVHFRGPELQFDALEVNVMAEDGSDTTYPIRVPGGFDLVNRRVLRRPRGRGGSERTPRRSKPTTSQSPKPTRNPKPQKHP